MAQFTFDGFRQLAKSLVKTKGRKNRIIAKAIRAPSGLDNAAFARRIERIHDRAIRCRQCDRTDETGRPIRPARLRYLLQLKRDTVRIGHFRAAQAGRSDPGPIVQASDL